MHRGKEILYYLPCRQCLLSHFLFLPAIYLLYQNKEVLMYI